MYSWSPCPSTPHPHFVYNSGFFYTQGRIKVLLKLKTTITVTKNILTDSPFKSDWKIKTFFFCFCKMPRHSPILQILVYFYSKQENCNIYLYIFTKTPSPKKQDTHCHYGIQRNFISKLRKKILDRSKHTYRLFFFFFTLVLVSIL